MPVSPDGGARFAKVLADLYGDAAQHLIALVADRLAAGITDPGWAERKLSDVLRLRRDAQRFVTRLADQVDASLYELLAEAYSAGVLAAGGPGVTEAQAGIVATNRGAVQAYAAELAGTVQTTHTRILRTAEDVYRRVIADVAGQVVTGVQTRREAAARAVSRFAQQGVTGYVDAKGRNWSIDTYAEMATRTTAGQAHLQGGIDRYQQQGRYLVVISDAPEECSLCRPWERTVLSLTGREPTPGEVEGHRYGGTLAQARAAGLFHPQCRHSMAGFIPGLTRPAGRPTAEPEGDALRQRQRALERAVRESKRRVAAAEPFGDTAQLARDRALLRKRQAALREFVAEHDRKADVSRRRVNLVSR
ncbi:phage minor capsid protein [Blastococcus mobilis]|uniref:Phage minor capsid protein 2 n=1 Tax=Blastococcus mobilis TaxID=1938746 RepID=A0A238VH44_9ACTN|nr:phage minor capsid protein [Blastococcus mobilis]SNR33003.1 Phage minor capsid protein 2 [Blastococcus mobilis]